MECYACAGPSSTAEEWKQPWVTWSEWTMESEDEFKEVQNPVEKSEMEGEIINYYVSFFFFRKFYLLLYVLKI